MGEKNTTPGFARLDKLYFFFLHFVAKRLLDFTRFFFLQVFLFRVSVLPAFDRRDYSTVTKQVNETTRAWRNGRDEITRTWRKDSNVTKRFGRDEMTLAWRTDSEVTKRLARDETTRMWRKDSDVKYSKNKSIQTQLRTESQFQSCYLFHKLVLVRKLPSPRHDWRFVESLATLIFCLAPTRTYVIWWWRWWKRQQHFKDCVRIKIEKDSVWRSNRLSKQHAHKKDKTWQLEELSKVREEFSSLHNWTPNLCSNSWEVYNCNCSYFYYIRSMISTYVQTQK